MQNALPKTTDEATQERANAFQVLLPAGVLTAAEAIELFSEIKTAHVERDPIRGGALS